MSMRCGGVVYCIAMASAMAVSASDTMIKANTGLPLNYIKGHYYTGTRFTPGRDSESDIPYWSCPPNTFPQYQFWTEHESLALTLAFSARFISNNPTYWPMINVMVCPNVDHSITNLGGATTNQFLVLDANNTGFTGGASAQGGLWGNLETNWQHYAVCYNSVERQWTYWRNGKLYGITNSNASYTNKWTVDSCMIISAMAFVPWNNRFDMDRLAAWHRELTDAEIQEDYLSWAVARFGVTEDPPYSISITSEDQSVTPPDSQEDLVVGDAVILKEVKDATKHNKRIIVTATRGYPEYGISAGPTNVCSIDGDGNLTHIEDGAATVTVNATNTGRLAYTSVHTYSTALATESTTTYSYTGGVAGSIRSAAIDWITPELAAGGDITMFSTDNHATTSYVRNASCWAAAVDLSCIPVWNSATDNSEFSPTLISPLSGLACNHAYPGNGSTVRWVTSGGAVVERTIVDSRQVLNDLRAFSLSAPITNITPAGLFASTNLFSVHTNGVGAAQYRGYRIPAVSSDQFLRATVRDVQHFSGPNGGTWFVQPVDTNRLAYYTSAISGDSGSPSFIIVSNSPVLIAVYTTGGAGSGPCIPALYDSITNVCRQLGDTNTISAFDTSGFTTY